MIQLSLNIHIIYAGTVIKYSPLSSVTHTHTRIQTPSETLCICKHPEGTMHCKNGPVEFVIQCELLSADK